MMVIRFRSSEEHEDLLKKVKRMKKFTEEIEECLEEAMEDDVDYRGGSYRKEWEDEDDMKHESRYNYRRRMR